MAEIVNLRQARKRAARRNEEAKAADNRVLFGLPKGEKRKIAAERARADAALDGSRLVSARSAEPETADDDSGASH